MINCFKYDFFTKHACISRVYNIAFLYIVTLSPGIVAVGDNAELITTSYILGIAHPPGYPLFNLLGKLFTFLPLSTIAYRVNLMSAVFSGLCVVLIYLIIYKITKDKISAITGSLSLAFSYLFWKYSILAEVFALNNLCTTALVLVILIWQQKRNIKFLYLFSFLYGLGLTNHQTLIFLLPAFFFLIFIENKSVFKPKSLSLLIIVFLLGLSIYLYLPLRASSSPEINWFNPTSLENFKKVVLRTIYGKPAFNVEQIFVLKDSVFYHYLFKLLKEFYFIGSIFILLSFWIINKNFLKFLLCAFILAGPFFMLFLTYDQNPIFFDIVSRFYLLSFVIISILLGSGIFYLKKLIPEKVYNVLPVIVLIPLFLNFHKVNLRNNYLLNDFCKSVLSCINPNKAILTITGDSTIMGLDYLQMVEQKCHNTKVFSLEKLSHKWYIDEARIHFNDISFPFERIAINETLEKFIECNKSGDNFYVMAVPDLRLGTDYKLLPYGLVSKVLGKNKTIDIKEFKQEVQRINKLKVYDYEMSVNKPNFESELIDYTAKSQFNVACFFHTNNEYEYAYQSYKKSIEINEKFPSPYKNLGVLLYSVGKEKEGREYFQKYLNLAPKDDKDLATITNILKVDKK